MTRPGAADSADSGVNCQGASKAILPATPGLDADLLETTTDERAALLVRRTALLKCHRLASSLDRFLANVDAEQVSSQIATLTAARDGIVTHRATLPA